MSETVLNQLNLFQRRPVLYSVAGNYVEEIPTKTTLGVDGVRSLQFSVPMSPTYYTDLRECYLWFKVRIVRVEANKAAYEPFGEYDVPGEGPNAAPQARKDNVAPVNNFLGSMIQSIDMYMNGVKVTTPNDFYPYVSFVANTFKSDEEKKGRLTAACYYEDVSDEAYSDEINVNDSHNPGMMARRKLFLDHPEVEMIDRLHIPPHTTDRYLLPFIALDYDIKLSPHEFALMYDGPYSYKYEIVSANLLVQRIAVNPGLKLAHAQLLSKENAVYPINRVAVTSFAVTTGSTQFHKTDLFSQSAMPTQVMVMFVPTAALFGNKKRNPLAFHNKELKSIALRIGDQAIPNTGYQLNFTQYHFLRLFHQTIKSLGMCQTGVSSFDRISFANNRMMPVWDLSRDASANASYISGYLDKRSIQLEGSFDRPLTENYTCIVLANFQSNIEIDSNYTPSTDY